MVADGCAFVYLKLLRADNNSTRSSANGSNINLEVYSV